MMDERLPEGWVWTTLGEISTKPQYGWTTKAKPAEGSVLLLRTTDISSGTIDWDRVPYCTETPENLADYLLKAGDIVISRAGSVGLSYLLGDIPKQTVFASYLIRFHPLQGAESRYMAYYLQTPEYWNRIHEESLGIALANVNASKLETIEIPLAPLPEQHRIVAAIEQQFTRLDSAVGSLQSAKARTKQYRASLLKAAVEGELTKEWRAERGGDEGEAGEQLLKRILEERRKRWEEEELRKMREKGMLLLDDSWRKKYKEPQGPDVEGLPELPEGWCWATVEQVSHFVRYGSSAKTSNDNTGVPVLRMGNIQDGRLDFTNLKYLPTNHPEFPALPLEKGDLLFNRTNSFELVGKSAVYRGSFPQCSYASYLICVRFLTNYLADFLCFYINSHYGRIWINSIYTQQTGQANVSGSKLQALAFPLPPLAEIEQIIAEVEARLSDIEQMEMTIEHSLKRAEHERQSILREAFAGRLVEQDPEDEPASVLLERIREERKRREEAEKAERVSRKGVAMDIGKRRRRRKKGEGVDLYGTLVEAGGKLTPDDLFKQADLQADEQPESGEVFYGELKIDVDDNLIEETRPAYNYVLLEALEPSDISLPSNEREALAPRGAFLNANGYEEVLARMIEEESSEEREVAGNVERKAGKEKEAETATQARESRQEERTVNQQRLWNL